MRTNIKYYLLVELDPIDAPECRRRLYALIGLEQTVKQDTLLQWRKQFREGTDDGNDVVFKSWATLKESLGHFKPMHGKWPNVSDAFNEV